MRPPGPLRIARGERIVLATHNPGKLAEIVDLLRPCGVDVVSAGQLGLSEPDETEPGFAGNARLKAVAATSAGLPALADDSGFCVAALGGAPGVLSARWAGPNKDFRAAMDRVWTELDNHSDRRAWFVSALCLARPGGHTATYIGRSDGTLAWPPRGDKGFGYDPIFIPAGETQTYGEMDPATKHATNHRARAMAQLLRSCFDDPS